MLNPELIMRGDEQTQQYIILEFANFVQEAEVNQ
ncbi:replication/maintenance protein RepL [Staphylococcus aureus]